MQILVEIDELEKLAGALKRIKSLDSGPRMDAWIRTDWVRALESGNYEQGKGVLKTITRLGRPEEKALYCCLGVACEVLVHQPQWENEVGFDGTQAIAGLRTGREPAVSFPPDALLAEWGLSLVRARALAELNDAGFDFGTIAHLIEHYC